MAATAQIEGSPTVAAAGLVGRDRELSAFRASFERMLGGRRGILTLGGEPGIGKTRLAEALAETAEDQGAFVLWGRCYEEPGAPPYWPWVQILRQFVTAASPSELRRLVGPGAPQLAALAPELGQVLGAADSSEEAPLEAGQARFLTFDAIGGFLRRAAEQVPIVLIIDNAHWADKASLALLEFLCEELIRSRVLLVCTYRDTEVSRRSPLLETLGQFGGGEGVVRLKLSGLARREIACLASRVLGKQLPDDIIGEIDTQTDGNPLFVIELLKVLIDESREAGLEPIKVRVPDGVRETIGRRLSRLPALSNDLLRVASVIGRHFGARELSRIAGEPMEAVLESLQLAETAGFLEQDDSGHAWRFTHALIRETLYDEIPTPDRLRLHGLVGDALLARVADHEQRWLSEAAYHYYESAALGKAGQAIDLAVRAGHEAMRLDAYEEAVIQYERVISLSKQHSLGGAEAIRQAIFWKSRALLGTGDVDGATAELVDSIGDGESIDDVEWLADVASLWAVLLSAGMQVRQLPLLRRVLALLPEGDSAARAKVLAALAFAERTLGELSQVHARIEESLAMARRLEDAATLSHCLRSAFLALNGNPAYLEQRLALGAEFIAVAPAGDHCERMAEARYQQAFNLIEAGRIDELERLLDDYETLEASRIGLHEYRTRAFRIVVSLLHGEYDGLAGRIDELRRIGHKTRREDAEGVFSAQMFALYRDLGRLGELAPAIDSFAAMPTQRAWTPGLMLALTEIGRLDAAGRELERLAQDGFSVIPNDDLRLTTLVYCAETCAALGDAAHAGLLYRLLSPYAGTFASHPTVVCFGSTELYLGMLAAAIGEHDAACGHFDAAIHANSVARAWPWLARSQYRYARALRASDRDDDNEKAEGLLREAEQLAGSLGMESLAAEIGRSLRGDGDAAAFPDSLTAREVDVLRLIAIGRSNRDIGTVLSISLNTVATHVRNILTKTDCANRTEAAAYASRNKLIDAG